MGCGAVGTVVWAGGGRAECGVSRCGIEGRSALTREAAERGVARLGVNWLPSPLLRKKVHSEKARRAESGR